jgi:hypothetical protein
MERDQLDRDIQINRLCKPANPAFTISKMMTCARISARTHGQNTDIPSRTLAYVWLVEPIGIEPTTSSLQSSRSPN